VVGELVAEDPGRALVANRAEVGLPVADAEIRDVLCRPLDYADVVRGLQVIGRTEVRELGIVPAS